MKVGEGERRIESRGATTDMLFGTYSEFTSLTFSKKTAGSKFIFFILNEKVIFSFRVGVLLTDYLIFSSFLI